MASAEASVTLFTALLDERAIKYHFVQDTDVVCLSFGGGEFSFQNVRFYLKFDPDGEGVHISSAPIVRVQREKADAALKALNDITREYRWVSVYLDEDSDVVYQFDAVVREDSLAEVCLELVMRCAACVDDFYPQLMKAVWS